MVSNRWIFFFASSFYDHLISHTLHFTLVTGRRVWTDLWHWDTESLLFLATTFSWTRSHGCFSLSAQQQSENFLFFLGQTCALRLLSKNFQRWLKVCQQLTRWHVAQSSSNAPAVSCSTQCCPVRQEREKSLPLTRHTTSGKRATGNSKYSVVRELEQTTKKLSQL